MVHACAAVGCRSKKKPGCKLSFYRFPKDPSIRKLWVAAIKRGDGWEPSVYSRLCGEHFISGSRSRDPMSPDYIPTIFNHVPSATKRKLRAALEKYEKFEVLKKKRTELLEQGKAALPPVTSGEESGNDNEEVSRSKPGVSGSPSDPTVTFLENWHQQVLDSYNNENYTTHCLNDSKNEEPKKKTSRSVKKTHIPNLNAVILSSESESEEWRGAYNNHSAKPKRGKRGRKRKPNSDTPKPVKRKRAPTLAAKILSLQSKNEMSLPLAKRKIRTTESTSEQSLPVASSTPQSSDSHYVQEVKEEPQDRYSGNQVQQHKVSKVVSNISHQTTPNIGTGMSVVNSSETRGRVQVPVPVIRGTDATVQTDVTTQHTISLEASFQEFISENICLKSKIKELEFDESSFIGNDEKVKFYTGFDTYSTLMVIYNYVKDCFGFSKGINSFSCFLLFLMKLRFNLTIRFLSYIFHVSGAFITKKFSTIMSALETRIAPALIVWPERERLQKCIPVIAQELAPRCVYIIDILEVPIERCSNSQTRKLTYSNTKSQHSMKYLLVMTPRGAVSFISQAWVGSSSDVYIVENSRFLELVHPGDIILASKQFNIGDNAELFNITLKIPAFSKATETLCKLDPEVTRTLSSVNICLDRVLGSVTQRYSILGDIRGVQKLEIEKDSNMSSLDKLVRVTCALANVNIYSSPFEKKVPLGKPSVVASDPKENLKME